MTTYDMATSYRVYREDTTSKAMWRVQYKSIPWENEGSDKLTVNFAIWVLLIISLNEGHRPIANKDMTLDLNVWWKDTKKDGSITYEHHLSGRALTEEPEGADVRARPTTVQALSIETDEIKSGLGRGKRAGRPLAPKPDSASPPSTTPKARSRKRARQPLESVSDSGNSALTQVTNETKPRKRARRGKAVTNEGNDENTAETKPRKKAKC
ncbi:hypothetical protein B0T17DRAFT_99184 [Bombardia bombarda]|uniref:Uncharacterized protein n=1 Tax=Bombardia bombarda TaxID=252184 RepID=A0AA39XN82_9PEZI|nr:hypothetical protein B0T17DRAFT_99184 [Bombardia bombarda]